MSKNPHWLLLPAALLLLGWLGYAPFWNPDEGRYASSSLEMIGGVRGSSPDWVVPHLDTMPRLNKPPLVYWLGAAGFKIFGAHEWAGRLVSALAAVLVLWLIYLLGRAMFNERTGILAALIWSSSLLPAAMGRTLNTDMLLCAATTLVFYGLWRAESSNSARRTPHTTLAGLGLGMAMLAKGPVGVALPFIAGAIFYSLTRRWRGMNWPGVLLAFFIGAAIAAPWFFAIEQRQPGFTKHFIFAENFRRFSGSNEYHKPSPVWFYFPVTLIGLLPWTPLALAAFARSDENEADRETQLYLRLWAGIIILFFSVSGTKLFSYVLPAFPALALLAAHGILRATAQMRRVLLPLVIGLPLAAAGGIAAFLLSNKILPRDVALPYVVALAAVLIGSAIFVGKFWWAGEVWRAGIAQFFGSALLCLCLLSFAGRLAPYEDASPLWIALRPQLKDDDVVAQVSSFTPAGIFYLRRPVMCPNFANTSGLEPKEVSRSPLFPMNQAHDLTWLLRRKERIFVLIRWRRQDYSVPSSSFTWARTNNYKLISNRPAPPDFRYDFTAPKLIALDVNAAYGLPPAP